MSVTLRLDEFGKKALRAQTRRGASSDAVVSKAARYYLADQVSGRVAWRVPRFLTVDERGQPAGTDVDLDHATMAALQREARRQGVASGRLAEHALLYFLADLDCGRAPQRVARATECGARESPRPSAPFSPRSYGSRDTGRT